MKISRSIVAAVAILLFPQLTGAVDEEASGASQEAGSQAGSQGTEKKAFTPKECIAVVKKVQESGRYTEESIVSICNEEVRSERCEFFAEALSLASSHADFKNESFCQDMEHAQFCSEIMDKLLESTAVSDLAFGECERAKPQHDEAYCRKIQQMLGYSVKNEDMDTMRACYMMEAYTNFSSSKELETSQDSPKARIITGSTKELEAVGEGKGAGHTTTTTTTTTPSNIGKPDIVLQPVPLENFGKGKGNMAKAMAPAAAPAAAAAAPKAPAPAAATTIIVEPIPAAPSGMKVVESAPATIISEPIPVGELQKQISKAPIPSQNSAVATLAFTIAQHAPAVSPSQVQTAAMPQAKVEPMLAQPAVARAEIQNGTLVMTGAAFGTVDVAKHGIEDTLRKQAVNSVTTKQVSMAIAAQPGMQPVAALPQQVVTVVPIAALQNMQIPSIHPTAQLIAITNAQVAAPQTQFVAQNPKSVAQPQVVQAVLQTVAGNVAQPLLQVAQEPNSRVVATSVSPATPTQPIVQIVATQPVAVAQPAVSHPAPATPTQPVVQVVATQPVAVAQPAVSHPASATPTQPIVQVVATQPVAVAQPAVSHPAPATPTQPIVQAVATQPVAVAQPAVSHPAALPSQAVFPVQLVQAAPAQLVQPVVQPVQRPVVQTTKAQVVEPVVQPVSRPAVQTAPTEKPKVSPTLPHIVQAVIVSSLAPVPQTQATSKVLPAEAPLQKNPVAKLSDRHEAARQAVATPSQGHAAVRTVSPHPVAGLTQKHIPKPTKVVVKKEKSDYSGFLSKFVAM